MKKLIPLLLLVVIFAAGCDLTGLTVTTSAESPVVSSFVAEPPSIAGGGSATLSWMVVGATRVSIDQGIGDVALSGSRAVMPSATTVYTLTATNNAGMSAMATAQVVVTGASTPAPTPTPTPTPTPGVPVVNYFIADPPVIPAGGSLTLRYDVSNATSVTIDPGVGPVGSLVGTTIVSPVSNTVYTLTATNGAWVTYMSVPVLVTGAPATGLPDLVITAISRTGDTVNYKIKNQGDAPAGPSTSRLSVDGGVKANDNVGALAPGQEITRSFAGYEYECSGVSDGMVAEADVGGAVVESSEANNANSVTWQCQLIIGPIVAVKFGPDLVIEDIWKESEITGDKIYYRIKNQGNMDAGGTTTSLIKYPCDICFPVASDTVLPLAAGASRQEKFAGYNFSATGGIFCGVKVVADRNGDVNEKDEDNNEKSVNCSGL